ncbi:MAG: cell wall hydrolase [Lachnospiraceae bacterium]|nr:cell wall hydrolase [Lachnospiraceae bacterium]
MFKSKKVLSLLLVFSMVLLWTIDPAKASARPARDVLGGENIGAPKVLTPDAYNEANIKDIALEVEEEEIDEIYRSNLVMADVKAVLNVRASADIESDIVGKIYKDCGGIVLERGEEWSQIQSGELIGWASNEYLLFDEEAEALAKSVGTMTAVGTADVTYVRSEPNTKSSIYGFLAKNALVEVISEDEDGWIRIVYDENEGYVQKEYVKVKFNIDHGETMEAIKERKRAEEEYKKSLQRQREAMQSDENVEKLLAALIQCEAGGEPYEGMLAVGAVVMNRVRSGAYPATVYDVIYASGQFTPAKSGSLTRVYNAGPKAICMQAAREVLNGYTNIGDMTHFRRRGTHDGFEIGNHVFY